MTILTRTRQQRIPSSVRGWSTFNNGPRTYKTAYGSLHTCVDRTWDRGDENPLEITHSTTNLVGTITGKSGFNVYDNMPVTQCQSLFNPPMTMVETFKDANQQVARDHPGEPAIDLPLFLFELKDVPSMLKHAYKRGKALERAAKGEGQKEIRKYLSNPKNPAEDWLNYHFGWAPFVNDLLALQDIPKYLSRRAHFLSLGEGQHIRTLAELGENDTTGYSNSDTYDTNLGITGISRWQQTSHKWIVAHWYHDFEASEAILHDGFAAARGALGLDVGLSTMWNAIPFTWLTDWFVDVGSLIDLKSNRAGISFKNASLMTHRTYTKTTSPKSVPKGYTITDSQWTKETKQRQLWSPSLPSVLGSNIFTPSRLATLASLQVTRGARVAF